MALRSDRRHVVLVTGASRGIGAAIARALGKRGAVVLVAARSGSDCAAVVKEIGASKGEARALQLDVAGPASIEACASECMLLAREIGPVDWLINNAGIAVSAPLVPKRNEDRELFERHMDVNFHGARRLVEAFLPGMRERGYGRIVNVASSAGLRGYRYASAYCASKFALVGYTLAAAEELAGSGVTLNAVCPHYVDSPMLEHAVARLMEKTGMARDAAQEFFRRENPSGKLVAIGQVAGAVVDLLEGGENGTLVELDGSPRAEMRRPNERRS